MSLLLDALKRAEEAKRQSGQPPPASTESLTLAPKEDTASPLPDLDSHQDTVDQQLRAEATAGSKPALRPTPSAPVSATAAPALAPPGGAAQAAARNVFAAKPPAPPARPKTLLIASVAGGIAALGIVGYFGYQYLQLTGMLAPEPTPLRPAIARAPLPPETARFDTAGQGPETASADLPATAGSATASATAAAPARPGTAAPSAPMFRRAAVGARPSPSPRDTGSERDSVRVSSTPKAVDLRLAAAYGALQSGQLAAAEAGYREVVAREPANVDALLGLAVIAARSGRTEDAQTAYLAVLESAPRNAAALAGLLSLSGTLPAAQRESRLKQLLAPPPADPTLAGLLHFALGNVYSEQHRWAEAQSAYFDATVADRDNPDYLYNLAVSLEHLQKPALAARQYEAAVRAAQQRPFAFDREVASARATALAR